MYKRVFFDNYEDLKSSMLTVIEVLDDVCVICDFNDAHVFRDEIDFNGYDYVKINIEDSDVDEDMPYYMVAKNNDEFIIQPVLNRDGELVRAGYDKVYIMNYVDQRVREFYEDSDSIEFVYEDEECCCECCRCEEEKYIDKNLNIEPNFSVEITVNGNKVKHNEKDFETLWKNLIEDMLNFKF